MQTPNFSTTLHAKCILIGEHAVTRGSSAIVTPVAAKKLTLHYFKTDCPLEIEVVSELPAVIQKTLYTVLIQATDSISKRAYHLTGKFELVNDIDVAAGLGFSAAMCVAVTQWLIWQGFTNENQILNVARDLENIFHGKSSGLDIVGVLNNHLTYFQQLSNIRRIFPKWYPKLYLSCSGVKKSTKDQMANVSDMLAKFPEKLLVIDNAMQESVNIFMSGLQLEEEIGLEQLVFAINQACQCFEEWQLITDKLDEHMRYLQSLGCIACKPTGAGGGGYVLSLWRKNPPKSDIQLLPIYQDL